MARTIARTPRALALIMLQADDDDWRIVIGALKTIVGRAGRADLAAAMRAPLVHQRPTTRVRC